MVQPGFAVDTHCHLFLVEQDTAEVVRAARRRGVERLICVGIDADSSRRSLELAESFRGVFATAGVHPHTASEFDPRAASQIEELLAHPLVVAVGETGLDYYRRLSPTEDQHRAFRTHIQLSVETGKPLVVHVREAWDDAMRILEEEGAERVVLHCFSGDAAIAGEAAARGYFMSFAGNVTYPKADGLRSAAAAAPEDQLLAETDSPFLTPQSKRGEGNTPANVLEVHAILAEARGVNVERMVGSTTEAALRAFPLIR
jgi:TatD DNase family protein